MNRWIVMSLAATAATAGGYLLVNPPVELQPSTPGTQQVGNANISGKLLVGTLTADSSATNAQVIFGNASAATGATYSGLFKNASSTGRAVRGYATSGAGSGTGGDFQTDSPGGTGVRGIATSTTGGNYGGYFSTASPQGFGVFGQNTSSTTGYGGYFTVAGPTATAVYGKATAASGSSYGGYFIAQGLNGHGLSALATASQGTTYGGVFSAYSPSGYAAYGSALATTGTNYGGVFRTLSPDGYGVYALSKGKVAVSGTDTSPSADSFGGSFQAQSKYGFGVFGFVSASTGDNAGVLGETNSHADGYGVFSNGRTGASGTKSFRIDHPLDPENKFLNHYCSEGPEPLNVYTGSIVTDSKGFAWVQLPDYFAEINKSPRYQLTVVDESEDFVLAKISKRLAGNRFQIRTSKPGVEVCWRIDAIRNDRFVRAYGAPVVTDKTDREKGRYQNPELYGKPKEQGIFYRNNVDPSEVARPDAEPLGKR